MDQAIEIGAEVFAAEFIYPERLFVEHLELRNISFGLCTQESLVLLKFETKTSLSYTALRKRAIRLGYANESLPLTGWRNLENALGVAPFRHRLLRQQ